MIIYTYIIFGGKVKSMESEAIIEQNLINQLIHGKSQWTLREDLKNEDQLWDNFFKILTRTNLDKLADNPLTDNEKRVIKSKITQPTFFKSAEWLAGANGQVRVVFQRDNTTLGTADLLVIDNTNIAGGNSVYEVVHQISLHKRNLMNHNRRYDVTLLINGLPLIHIELKNRAHSTQEAFNQIQKYIDEGLFHGIFSNVQMFVISNGVETQYIAADQHLRKEFLTHWVDEDNKPVHDYIDFAKAVLSIPAAHNMIAEYSVLDNEQKHIILLRPYQINAIEAIKDASIGKDGNGPQSGFIWHTTGSGKTLTSYKVAHNLLKIPSIEKTVFLIDRNDLDTQTTAAFKTYAQSDTIQIEETESSYELARKLTSPDKKVIVATRQKMQALFKRMREDEKERKIYDKLQQLNLAFIVDECHRAVSPDQMNEMNAFFAKKPRWYGFTGTPIFAENAREEKGANARTTEQQYGPCLAKYTIKDAIRDKSVLGFQVEEQSSDDYDEKDDNINQIYNSESHMRAVVKSIVKRAYRKQGIYNKDRRGYAYDAIFTTSSIKQAQKYYKLFKELIKGTDPDFQVPPKIKRIMPDFPKVAITYSVGENGDGDEANQKEMCQSLTDYNEMFNTSFSMDELKGYNINVNNRLARKKAEFKPRDQQLDIVIVVDRLLTGFDAPALSTLYIDRPPMPAKDLIQAFSRTNRIFDKDKKYGQVVTFQYPEKYKEKINNALMLYSNGGTNDVMAPDWATSKQRFENSERKIIKYKYGTGGSLLDAPIEKQKQFLKEYQEFDKAYAAAQTYSEFSNINPEDYGLDESFVEELKGTYEVIKEKIKQDEGNNPPVDDNNFDPYYELEVTDTQTVDYTYIIQLIQAYIPSDKENETQNKAEISEIDNYIAKLAKKNKKLADIMLVIWTQVQLDPESFRDKQINELVESMMNNAEDDLLKNFANRYSLNLVDLKFVIRHYDPEKDARDIMGMSTLLSNESFTKYKETHLDAKKLHWKKEVRSGIKDLYVNEVKPLNE